MITVQKIDVIPRIHDCQFQEIIKQSNKNTTGSYLI